MAEPPPRKSLRLQGKEPEIKEITFKCHFCLVEDYCCNTRNVQQLHCCHQFVHTTCQKEWDALRPRQHCAMCRQEPPAAQARTESILTNEEVVNRLRTLLNSGELREQLSHVSAIHTVDNHETG